MGSKVMGAAAVALLVVGGVGCGKSSSKATAASPTAGTAAYCKVARQEAADPKLAAADPATEFTAVIGWRTKEAAIAPSAIKADVQADLASLKVEQTVMTKAGFDDSRVSAADRATLDDPAVTDRADRIDQFNQAQCHMPAPAGAKFSQVGSAIQ
jgi:hypothetical protein